MSEQMIKNMSKVIDQFKVVVGVNQAWCSIYKDLRGQDETYKASFVVKDAQEELGPFDIEQPDENIYLNDFRRYVQQHLNALLYFRNRVC